MVLRGVPHGNLAHDTSCQIALYPAVKDKLKDLRTFDRFAIFIQDDSVKFYKT